MIKYNYYLIDRTANSCAVGFNANCSDGRIKFSLLENVNTKDWNKKAGRSNEKNANINIVLGRIDLCIKQLDNELTANKSTIGKVRLKREILAAAGNVAKEDKKEIGFVEVCKKISKDRETGGELNEGGRYAINTVKSYNVTINVIDLYIKTTGANMNMHTFGIEDYELFLKYLISLPNYNKNSIASHIKNLKIFIGAAYANPRRWHKNLIFRDPDFKSVPEHPENIDVSMSVLNKMDEMELEGKEAIARDWFIVESMTALRVSDTTRLTQENIVGDTITNVSKKTTKKTIIPISNLVSNVLVRNNGGWPPKITVDDINTNIREVARRTGMLDKKVLFSETRKGVPVLTYYHMWEVITTHTGRRSFVSNARRFNIDSADRSKLAGMTEATMARYDKVSHEEVAQKVAGNSFFK